MGRWLLVVLMLHVSAPAFAKDLEVGDVPHDYVGRDVDGNKLYLSELKGRVIVVSFWATWCAPCREEMPTLEALASGMEGRGLAVLTIATGRNSPQGITRFFAEAGVETLPRHTDPGGALARTMGVMGLPVTLILDPEGREIARLIGEADWNAPDAHAILEALMAGDDPG